MIYYTVVQTRERAATAIEALIEMGGFITAVTQERLEYTIFALIPDAWQQVDKTITRWDAVDRRIKSAILVTNGAYPEP